MSTWPIAEGTAILGGRFVAQRLLGRARGVETHLGQDREQGAQVVIKAIAEAVLPGPVRTRLAQEATALKGLVDLRPVPLLEWGSEDGHLCLVAPYVPGTPLREVMRRRPLSVAEAIVVARHSLEQLDAAHRSRVLHRNIRPSNVIVQDGDGSLVEATLVDFGLSPADLVEPSLRDVPLETVRYLSPEQAGLLRQEVDRRSDLYLVGLLLYECLAGHPPYVADSVGELLLQHLNAPLPSLRGLGLQLPRALEELVQRLLQKEPADRYQSAQAAAMDLTAIERGIERGEDEPGLVIGLGDRRRLLTEPAFVGRRDELHRLEQALVRARLGEGGLVTVEGDSGSGKTLILEELARRAAARGQWVLRGSPRQAAQRPFALVEAVAQTVATRAKEDPELAQRIHNQLGDLNRVLASALPTLSGLFGEPAVPASRLDEHGEARARLAIHRFLAALGTAETSAVVLLDDCQWADHTTLGAIVHQERPATEETPSHVLLVAAFRPDEVSRGHPLREADPIMRVVFSALTDTEIRHLLESMAGPLPAKAVETVVRLAGGNPSLAAASLWGLVEAGALMSGAHGWEEVPGEMVHVQASRRMAVILTRRLEQLQPAVRQVLGAAAVLGHTFELGQVEALAGMPTGRTRALLREARRRHLVWSDAQMVHWHFMHSMLRESLLAQVPEQTARELHLRAAETLLARPEGSAFDSSFAIAHHFDAAGASESALPHALEAAERARDRYALDVAERHYRIAERGSAAASPAVRQRVAEGLGEVLLLRNHHQEARRQLRQALSLCDNDLARARIQIALGRLAYRRGETAAADEAFEQALRLLGQPVPRSSASMLASVCQQAAARWADRRRRTRRPSAPERHVPPGEREQLLLRLHTLLPAAWWHSRGILPALWSHFGRLRLAEGQPPSAELGLGYAFHGRLLGALSLFGLADRYCEMSRAICAEAADPWGQGHALYARALVYYASARFDAAQHELELALPLLEQTADTWLMLSALGILGCVHLRKGELQRAERIGRQMHEQGLAHDQALPASGGLDLWAKASGGQVPAALIHAELRRAEGDLLRRSFVVQAEGLRLLRAGEPDQAAALLEELWGELRRARLFREHVFPAAGWLLTAYRLAASQLPPGSAPRRRLLEAAHRVARPARLMVSRFPNHRPHVLRECGLLAAMDGNGAQARRYLDRSVRVARRQGARYELGQSLLARSVIGRSAGLPGTMEDHEEGLRLVRAAGSDFALGEVLAPSPGPREPAPATLSLADRLDQMLEAGHRIARSLSREAVFDATREAASNLIRGQHCLVLEVHGPPGPQKVAILSGDADVVVSRTLVKRAISSGKVVVAAFGLSEGQPPSESIILSGVRSALAAPIPLRQEGPSYCLYLTHERVGGLFGEEEERLVGFIASLAGAALENTQTYLELESAFEALGKTHRQLKSTQGQLVQAAKLAALGQLGAGIAHELNQPIQSIQGFAQRILRHAGGQIADHMDELEIIVNATHRMARIVQNIRMFARDSSLELELIDPATPITDALMLLTRQLENHRIEVCWEQQERLPRVLGDSAKLQQVFLNLILNARDALTTLPIAVPRRIVLAANVEPDRVAISVQDNGPGIRPEHEDRIFDPFFTTKEAGLGTGLGLSISYGIIKEHGGELLHEHVEGGGARFVVGLPLPGADR